MYEEKTFAVYIMTNSTNTVLYTGMSGNFPGRILQHKEKLVSGFAKKYDCTKLVYFEICEDSEQAAQREHQIKAGSRKKKILLIGSINPEWLDLYDKTCE